MRKFVRREQVGLKMASFRAEVPSPDFQQVTARIRGASIPDAPPSVNQRRTIPMPYENILTETRGRVGIATLNRPRQLNALSDALMDELGDALRAFDDDDAIGAIVITGSERAFAAGADVGAMADRSYIDVYKSQFITRNWETIRLVRKPVIAAVGGVALGGGCELAMMCDIVIAADTAKFGQPEIKLGIIPGAGGTQRMPRAVGKAKAMDLILTGRMMDAQEAERAGLVSRIVAADKLLDEALAAANAICDYSMPAVMMAKEGGQPGVRERARRRRPVRAAACSIRCSRPKTRKEGMRAFIEKRKPAFRHR
jgi:enoyl-CoA hydratase